MYIDYRLSWKMYICTLVLSCVGNITLVANNDIGGCSFTELKGVRNSNFRD